MKNKTLIMCIVALLVIATTLVAGCNNSDAPAETSSSTTEQSQPAAQQEVIEWRIQTMFAAGMDDQKEFAEWENGFCYRVNEASGGRLIITPFTSGQLVPMMESFDAIGQGTIDGSVTSTAYWAGKEPVAAFGWGLPYSFYQSAQGDTVLHELGLNEIIREAFMPYGVYHVENAACGYSPLLSKKPVYSVEDLKGMKIRATGMCGDVLAKAGAAMTYFPANEIYMALETGALDAAHFGGLQPETDLGLHEVTDYYLAPAVTGFLATELNVNLDKWNALPDDLKLIVEESAYYYLTTHSRRLQLEEQELLNELIVNGDLEISEMSAEDSAKMTDITLEVMAEYAEKDDYCAQAYTLIKDYMELVGIAK